MVIEGENISFFYGERRILAGINFNVSPGEFFCVLGPNGSGKTTLMKRICGFLSGSGSIRIDRRPLKSLKRREIARLVAVVPQRSALGGGLTVRETVEMGRYAVEEKNPASRNSREIVEGLIETLGLGDCADRDVGALSGGEFQKVLLARALAQEPRILILDEATAHLDIHHSIEIFTRVKNLTRAQDLTALAVVHDINLAAGFADRMMVLDNGTCAGIGPPEEILTEALLKNVFHIQASIFSAENGVPVVLPRLRRWRRL
jgi:iron complex transport system ATP-binding protein